MNKENRTFLCYFLRLQRSIIYLIFTFFSVFLPIYVQKPLLLVCSINVYPVKPLT